MNNKIILKEEIQNYISSSIDLKSLDSIDCDSCYDLFIQDLEANKEADFDIIVDLNLFRDCLIDYIFDEYKKAL